MTEVGKLTRAIICIIIGLGMTNISIAETSEAEWIERGKYVVTIGGCNDCHTPGYLMSEGNVPVDSWLIGDSLGWRGPWGTTYAPNLRLLINALSEEQWIEVAKTLKTRPPMPWFNLNLMHTDDLKSIYHFVNSLGPAGESAPDYVPPDQEPNPPFATFPAPPPE